MICSVGRYSVVGCEGVAAVDVTRSRVAHGSTVSLCVVHVSDGHVICSQVTLCIVLELDLIGDVVEYGLVITEIILVVSHVTPFNNEHLGRVSNFEAVG